jgi:hypothetical protein
VLDHLPGVVGKLGERGFSGEQLLGEVFAVLDAIDGLVEDDGGSGEVLLFDSSDLLKELDVLSEHDKLILGDSEFGRGFPLLDIAVIQLLSSDGQGFGGIRNLANSESDFGVALSLLSGVEVVVGELFSVNSGLEVIEHLGDCVQGVPGLQLRFNLNHDFHDVSVGHGVEFMLLEKVNLERGDADKSN